MTIIFVEILQPPTDAQLGSLCLMCSPSEGVGSLIVLLAEADLTLNILLIVVINLAALGLSSHFYSLLVLLVTTILLSHTYDSSGQVRTLAPRPIIKLYFIDLHPKPGLTASQSYIHIHTYTQIYIAPKSWKTNRRRSLLSIFSVHVSSAWWTIYRHEKISSVDRTNRSAVHLKCTLDLLFMQHTKVCHEVEIGCTV